MKEKVKILIVDDEKNIINALRRALKSENFELHNTTDSNEAMTLIRKNHYDVVICDQKMEGPQGTEVLEYCSKVSNDTIRILMTGFSDINVLTDAVNKSGIHYYISKPWNNKELVEVINNSLAGRKINKGKEELINFIWKHKEKFETIVDSLNSFEIPSGSNLSDENTYVKEKKQPMKISVKKDDSIILLDPSDIYYLTARNGKVMVVTKGNCYHSWKSMNAWEERLKDYNFFRCHRSYIVNVEKIEEIIPWFNDTYNLKLKDLSDSIYISKSYIKLLKNKFNIDSTDIK